MPSHPERVRRNYAETNQVDVTTNVIFNTLAVLAIIFFIYVVFFL
jgi:hypothetical protein